MSAPITFSLIVNTNDRAEPLATLLRALEGQSYPHFEVLVVVGPTRDHTLDVVRPYGARLRVLRCPQPNLSISRNIGLLAACGEIVAYIDDDAVPCRNWLAQLAARFADPLLDASGGDVRLVHPNRAQLQHRLGIISALAEHADVRRGWLDRLAPPPGAASLWTPRMMGANMAFRRRALLAVGGFDEYYAYGYEDPDAALRLALAGGHVLPLLEAPVYHVPASSRYREALTLNQQWWLYTRTAVYYSIKSGRKAGESWRAIARRCVYLTHGHWKWAGQLAAEGRLTPPQRRHMRFHEVRSGLQGALSGLLRPRRLLTGQAEGAAQIPQERTLEPFLNEQSRFQPAVDPVSGRTGKLETPDEPLRVCLLSQAYPPAKFDGVGRSTHLLARGLFELGHHVHVVTRGQAEQIAYYDGAYVHQIPLRLNRYERYRLLPATHATLNYSHAVYEKVQMLQLNDGIQLVDSPLWQVEGLVTEQSGRLPVVVRPVTAIRQIAELQHNHDQDQRMLGDLEQALLERAAFLVANSQATVKALQTVYSLPLSVPRDVVAYGIAPVPDEAVRPFDPARRPDTPLTILFLGRLEKRKGILDLFAAIPRVLEQTPGVRFVIAGADNSLADGFQAQHGLNYPAWFARQHPAALPHVEFLGGVSEERLNQLYQECDLFVAPSLYESFGLIYLEAMNYGKAVVGCRAGGIPEVVDDGGNGLLVEPEAPAALAEAIVRLVRSPQLLRDMGLAGRSRLLERFTYLHMARGFAAAYRTVLGQRAQVSEQLA
jgi:glycosyltransferase involved in cell wall biosynthesis